MRGIILLFCSWLAFQNNHLAWARTCTYKNNQDLEPKNFFREPQDQDGAGWCYAYALADLLSAKLK